MKLLYSPQRSDEVSNYTFEGEKIYLNGTLVIDFAQYPEDGELIEPEFPILSAKRESGIMSVVLVKYHEKNASEEERFPVWQEV